MVEIFQLELGGIHMSKERNSLIRQEDLDRLYRKYKPELMQFVAASVQDEDVAEDIVHETFYVAIRRYDTFCEHPEPIGWLYKVAKFKIKEYYRRLKSPEEPYVEEVQDEKATSEEGYSKAEMEIVICETLTDEELLRFRRYYVWGETPAEIAAKEHITENNLRVRLSRLKQKILNAVNQG